MQALQKATHGGAEFFRGRTGQQNRAFHLWLRQVADSLVAHGVSMNVLVSRLDLEVLPTAEGLKALIVREVIQALYGTRSTASLSVSEFSELTEVLRDAFQQSLGVPLPAFPGDSVGDPFPAGREDESAAISQVIERLWGHDG